MSEEKVRYFEPSLAEETLNRLLRQAQEIEELKDAAYDAERERDEARAELARVQNHIGVISKERFDKALKEKPIKPSSGTIQMRDRGTGQWAEGEGGES